MSRDHRKLEVFKIADELAILMFKFTTHFPAEGRFGLRAQLRRAAVSIPTNLVEGCARETERDFLRFVDISFGSAREVTYLASLAQRLGYLDEASAAKAELKINPPIAPSHVLFGLTFGISLCLPSFFPAKYAPTSAPKAARKKNASSLVERCGTKV